MGTLTDRHPTLTGYDFTKDAPLTPMKAIRQKCLECQGGSSNEVKSCHITDCTLWPFRLGRNPKRSGIGGKNLGSSGLPAKNAAG